MKKKSFIGIVLDAAILIAFNFLIYFWISFIFQNQFASANLEDNSKELVEHGITNKAFAGVKVPDLFASGSIVSKNGNDYYVLTNYHVADNDSRKNNSKIVTYDGIEHNASVDKVDTNRDLALIKFNSDKQYPTYKISTSAKDGEDVFIVGIPWNFNNFGKTFSGHISTKPIDPVIGSRKFISLWTVDVATYEGNSGGPTLNKKGEILGIVQGYDTKTNFPLVINCNTINDFMKTLKVSENNVKVNDKSNKSFIYIMYYGIIGILILVDIISIYLYINIQKKRSASRIKKIKKGNKDSTDPKTSNEYRRTRSKTLVQQKEPQKRKFKFGNVVIALPITIAIGIIVWFLYSQNTGHSNKDQINSVQYKVNLDNNDLKQLTDNALIIINHAREKLNRPKMKTNLELSIIEKERLADGYENGQFYFHYTEKHGFVNEHLEKMGIIKKVDNSYKLAYGNKNYTFNYQPKSNFFEDNGIGFNDLYSFLCGDDSFDTCGSKTYSDSSHGLLGHEGHREKLLDLSGSNISSDIGCAAIWDRRPRTILTNDGKYGPNLRIISGDAKPIDYKHSTYFGCIQY